MYAQVALSSKGEQMKHKRHGIYAPTAAALVLVLILSLTAMPGAMAADDVFVNGEVLPGGLTGTWALGSGGAAQLSDSDVYVMTADGIVRLGDGAAIPEGDPEHLEVSGTVSLPYDKVRVALYYYDEADSIRNPTLDTANLENAVGSGYSFGYYDEEREFQALGHTDETKITMAMDRNVVVGGKTVGCYHILLPEKYTSFSEASAAASRYADGFPAYYNGEFRVLYGAWETSGEAQLALYASGGNGAVYTATNRCVVVTRTSDGRILFEFDCGSQRNLAVEPVGDNALTWFKGNRYFGGFEYRRRTGGQLTVINVVGIEEYVRGVLPYEMNNSWPAEALKTQAVCARTYAARHFDSLSAYQADLTNDTYSQVYWGYGDAASENTDAAVEATAGVYITYDGRLIDAMYCSSTGGATESSENVMYSSVPYLRGKVDPYEAAADSINANSSWTRTLTSSAIAGVVNGYGHSLSGIESITTELSPSGNVIAITFTDAAGASAVFEKSACYNLVTARLGLNSIHFEVRKTPGGFEFTGGGWGHSVGVSQYGAYAMADTYGFTYDQIINFYYTGVELNRGVY